MRSSIVETIRCLENVSVQIPEARPQPSMRDDARSLVIDGLDDRPSIIRFAQISRLSGCFHLPEKSTSSLFFFFFFFFFSFFFFLFFLFFFFFSFFFSPLRTMSLDGIRWQVRRLPDVSQVASSSGRGSVCNGNRGKESLVRENSRGVSRWEFSLDGGWYVRGFRYLILWLASSGFSTCCFFFLFFFFF